MRRYSTVLLLPSIILFLFVPGTSHGEASRALHPGDTAPGFMLQTAAGKSAHLDDYAGSPVIIVFWSLKNTVMTEHSRETIRVCRELERRYTQQHLRMLAVQLPPFDVPAAGDFISEHLAGIPVVQDIDKAVYRKYGIFLLPSVVIMDASHTIHTIMGFTSHLAERIGHEMETMFGVKRAESSPQNGRTIAPSPGKIKSRRYLKLAERYRAGKRYEKALAEADKAIDAWPGALEAYFLKTRALILLERYPEAKTALAKALHIRPDAPQGKVLQARLLLHDGDLKGAETILRDVEKTGAIQAEAWALLGKIHARNNNLDDAVAAYEKALKCLLKDRF